MFDFHGCLTLINISNYIPRSKQIHPQFLPMVNSTGRDLTNIVNGVIVKGKTYRGGDRSQPLTKSLIERSSDKKQ
jgi:hypothetical protein